MFLLETRQPTAAGSGPAAGPAVEFHVLGATGNVYQVRISRQPNCSCPDFAKGHLCKHILFVMLRVLRQRPTDPVIWQRALLPSEVERLLSPMLANASGAGPGAGAAAAAGAGAGAAAGVDRSVLASDVIRQRYAAIAGGTAAGGAAGAGASVQRPVEGDCPICYEEMVAGAGRGAEAITFCASCGNNMHRECFSRWAASKRSGGSQVTCVYCRAPWQDAGGPGPGTPGGAGGREYVNLSQYGAGTPSLEELYGENAYWVMANAGDISRRQAARMHAAARGWV
ncbi:hypothetical protein GPECTOR_5g30 [Gonium pectorale]|uniref:SWIM-type domain-containing protein n=1 Tax=Gonium pectorale TaxID=33097 RepID=A0A150GWD6_GONPE|nr:hypothetical protein GPECTOR_5g30 [Gonium pectorale]|eukprot:KXZ54207.1 hypothetical protein GPECTOR_5g30 [Gonium pectorale]